MTDRKELVETIAKVAGFDLNSAGRVACERIAEWLGGGNE